MAASPHDAPGLRDGVGAFFAGMGVGTLGGLIGLGGAEFRLPLLIGLFRFGPLEAVIVNKAMSLIVVASALPLRTGTISFAASIDWTGTYFVALASSCMLCLACGFASFVVRRPAI